MTVVPWFTVCIAINTIWAIFCIIMNRGWKKNFDTMNEEWCTHCDKLNDKWSKYCIELLERSKGETHDSNRRETDDPGYSQDSDSSAADRKVDERYGADGEERTD